MQQSNKKQQALLRELFDKGDRERKKETKKGVGREGGRWRGK